MWLRPLPRVLLVIVLAACDSDSRPEPSVVDDVPVRDARVVLRIGAADGPAELTFGRVGGLAADPTGRIFVADLQGHTIRAFDSGGAYAYTLAQSGQGPGEVRSPCCLAVDGTGRLWVRDIGNARYQAFHVGQEGQDSSAVVRMANRSPSFFAPITFRGDALIDIGMGGEPKTHRFWVVEGEDAVRTEAMNEPDPEDLGASVISVAVQGGRSRLFFWPPHGPRYLSAHGPEGAWAEARSDRYRVVVHRPSADSVVLTRSAIEPPALSQAEREAAATRIAQDRERAGARSNQIDWDVPTRKQPLEALYFDQVGRLWVERSVPEGSPREADLYSSDGRLIEVRRWPREVRLGLPGWADESTALGISSDSLDIQTVVKLEWRNP